MTRAPDTAAALARVFSPNNTVAQQVGEPIDAWICMDCTVKENVSIAQLLEANGNG